jgi:hypothetical protein
MISLCESMLVINDTASVSYNAKFAKTDVQEKPFSSRLAAKGVWQTDSQR